MVVWGGFPNCTRLLPGWRTLSGKMTGTGERIILAVPSVVRGPKALTEPWLCDSRTLEPDSLGSNVDSESLAMRPQATQMLSATSKGS